MRSWDYGMPAHAQLLEYFAGKPPPRRSVMPTDGKFGFSVLIAGLPVPEYLKDGRYYVESNLWTPVSYKQLVRELAYGEVEEQEWPVTPYQIKLYTLPHCPVSRLYVYVDGIRVYKATLSGGECRTCKGFDDAEGTKEFLFALPRFARDETDRVVADRKTRVGTIEVVCYQATFRRTEYRDAHRGDTDFEQANKDDACEITKGRHTMSTTKKGKIIHRAKPYPSHGKMKSIYKTGAQLGRLSVEYHMPHTLQDMGIRVEKVEWTQSHNLTTCSSVKSE